MQGLRIALLALAAGSSLSLAWPEANLAPLAWVGLAPLFVLCRGRSAPAAFGLGMSFGAGFFGTLLVWISIVGWVAWGCLVALQSLFIATFALLWSLAARAGATARVAAAAALWPVLEWVRASVPWGGFTWGELAQSQHNVEWMLRPAAIGGAALVAALLAGGNAALAEAARRNPARSRAAWVLGAAAVVAAPALLPGAPPDVPRTTVAIVQGNVPEPWSGSFYAKDRVILASHARLTRALDDPDLDFVVWPESAVGIDFERDPEVRAVLSDAARSAGVPLIVGGNLDLDDDRYKVMAFLVGPDGTVSDRYQKTHLVPFGEYVPGRELLDFIPMLDQVPRDAVPGRSAVPFDVGDTKIAPVISFEGDFGRLVRERMAAGADALVVATNTSTWGESWASAQHVAMSQVRAAENHTWVVHAALSGISALIDPAGRIVDMTPLNEESVLIGRIGRAAPTIYTRFGDWWLLLASVAGLVLAARGARKPPDRVP